MSLDELQQVLSYQFYRVELLELALRHESYTNEQDKPEQSNERLEFLGDSVLGLVVCDHLYHQYPDQAEGRLARVKAQLVSTEQLAEQARHLDLGKYVQFGRGERQTGKDKASVLADTLEAVIGAIYLDRGFDAAQSFILRQMSPILHDLDALTPDYKSTLQERAQRDYQVLPDYRLVSEEGPSHDKTFVLQVSILGHDLAQGTGRSKREAGQQAAAQALACLDALEAPLPAPSPNIQDSEQAQS